MMKLSSGSPVTFGQTSKTKKALSTLVLLAAMGSGTSTAQAHADGLKTEPPVTHTVSTVMKDAAVKTLEDVVRLAADGLGLLLGFRLAFSLNKKRQEKK